MTTASAIINAVAAVVKNPQEAMAMLYACGAESNCESIQNLGGAPAYGPWQIYLPYNSGVSAQQANDPGFAAAYMYTHHNVSQCTANQGQLWQTNANAAALAAARCIEGATPVEPYSASQQSQGAAWMAQASTTPQPANAAAQNIPVIGGLTDALCRINPVLCAGFKVGEGVVSGQSPQQAIASTAFGALRAFFSQDLIIRALLVIGGTAFILMGVSSLLHIESAAPMIAAAAA